MMSKKEKEYIKMILKKVIASISGVFWVTKDAIKYNRKNSSHEFPFHLRNIRYIFSDIVMNAGTVDSHYFLQDIYMAKKVAENHPTLHYDIGSRVDGFIGHLLCNSDIEKVIMIDIRPFPIKIDKLEFMQGDAMNFDTVSDNSIDSLSSLHAVEHFGLGRYGDPIDPNGWKKSLLEIQKKMKAGGLFYFSVPVGREQKVCFNAHRVFNPHTIINTLYNMELLSFSYIHNLQVNDVPLSKICNIADELGNYDCGMFVFKKR